MIYLLPQGIMSTFDEVEVLRDQLQAAQRHAELVKQIAALERQRADERADALQQHIDQVNFRYRLHSVPTRMEDRNTYEWSDNDLS